MSVKSNPELVLEWKQNEPCLINRVGSLTNLDPDQPLSS